MTTNTPAPATRETGAPNLRTSEGGRGYVAEYFAKQIGRHDFARYITDTLAADFACALAQHLSKLRAPVADERVALSQYDYQALFDAIGKAVKVHPNLAIEISVQAFRAALASAPVAAPEGNADAWLTLDEEDSPCMLFFRKEEARTYCNPDEEPIALVRADRPRPEDTGAAVRILFPTHLRKMWSGGEVQAWLDEHQGVTAPTPSAKGSLDRYRRWRAEQASEAQCSCPSGDGSLRWPCAKHPQAPHHE